MRIAPLWWWLLTALILTQIATFATSIYLHRALAHKSLKLSPALDFIFRMVIWLTTGQVSRQWVAVHRKHHAFTDREGDPHSPRLFGFWRVQFGNVYYYMKEARNLHTISKYASDIREDRWDRFIFSRGLFGLATGVVGLCAFFGIFGGLAISVMHTVLYVFVVAPLINGLGHWSGQQNFKNTARNSRVLALFTAGESLHNNHHAYQHSPRFSMFPREFDPSWLLIKVFKKMRCLTVSQDPVFFKKNS